MRNIIVIVFIILAFACKTTRPIVSSASFSKSKGGDTTKIDTPISDSLSYLKEIVKNRQKYINQPLSVLLGDLKIQVKSYMSDISFTRDLGTGMTISFDGTGITSNKETGVVGYGEPAELYIKWQKPISKTEARRHLNGTASGVWTAAEQEYYGKQIVDDVAFQHPLNYF
jgi:hypothetical protein